ncbi:MAG: GTPase Era [Acidimicrobiales bacterium]|nr:MAG: GTPase Era [Acidimicrobiales bacterium]
MRSGFVAIVGRPNVGKSTLLNRMIGRKVAIVSDKPQTTRTRVRGILDTPDAQVVFVDTPGLHKPRTALGERLNITARESMEGVDLELFVIDATKPIGRGDEFIAGLLQKDRTIVAVNKVDVATKAQVAEQLARAGEWDFLEYFPVSAVTGEGVPELVKGIVEKLPEGPRWYPEGTVTDVPAPVMVAELVREELLKVMREELPHSIATRVVEWDWPRIRVEIIVERESQKGMVIGKGGRVLKRVGVAVRRQLPPGVYLELHVRVDRNWQRSASKVQGLGY